MTRSPVLVTGGTGTLGRLVVEGLRPHFDHIRVLSRSSRGAAEGIEYVIGDLATGDGVEAAAAGVELVIHLAGSASGDEEKARNLVQALGPEVRHLLFVSVVGADRVPVESRLDRAMFRYFASKRAAEAIIASSGVPWTTLRATQFHDLLFASVSQMARMLVVPVPSGMRFQPIEAAEVADRVVELALGGPSGLVADLGGPRVYDMKDLVRSYLRAKGRRRLLLPMRLPGKAARSVREGALLAPGHTDGVRTWEAFLEERLGLGAAPVAR